MYCKLKNVKIGDAVITHNNSLKSVEHIEHSVKNGVQICTNTENIVCSENHRWLIYDKDKNEFCFKETKNLDKKKHQLVKNYLSFLDSFDKIIEICETENSIDIKNDKNEEWHMAKTNNIAVFDVSTNRFFMKKVAELKKGEILFKINQ